MCWYRNIKLNMQYIKNKMNGFLTSEKTQNVIQVAIYVHSNDIHNVVELIVY